MDLVAHLKAFVAVAEERSFTRAADLCGVPQPVISRRVAALEKHFDGALLRRTSREVELTGLGLRILPYATDLAARADHLEQLARRHDARTVVALPHDADARGLVEVRRAGQVAGLDLGFLEMDPTARVEALRTAEASVAVQACPLGEEAMTSGLGGASRHDVGRGRRFHLDHLRRRGDQERAPVLHLDVEDDVPWIRDALLRAGRAHGLAPHQVRVGASRTEALTATLDLGDTIVCTPAWAARHDLRWQPLGGLDLHRSFRFATPPGSDLPEGLAEITAPLAVALGLA